MFKNPGALDAHDGGISKWAGACNRSSVQGSRYGKGETVGQVERVLKHEQKTWALVQALDWCILWNWDSVSSPITERFILHGLL